ncbi:pseudouridine synthase [Sordaria brevicollis]|uniref:Pseudouridine synthase n=1 Tax=Sordaria brevicollis TaxID=83679 RepID=A0AAE0PC84_SORBR|nr:pseudouridine synthase [Sordaria brevicollis]
MQKLVRTHFKNQKQSELRRRRRFRIRNECMGIPGSIRTFDCLRTRGKAIGVSLGIPTKSIIEGFKSKRGTIKIQLRTFTKGPTFHSQEDSSSMAKPPANYDRWPKESLVKRIQELEDELRRQGQGPEVQQAERADERALEAAVASTEADLKAADKKKKKAAKFDPGKYSTRLIALKFAYLGKNYNGFEYQSSAKMPSIEEELWKALVKSCLIFPERPDEVDFGPWEYSKCGRTDRGVSAFGQVIGIRVRSNKPLPKEVPRGQTGGEDVVMAEATAQQQAAEGSADVDHQKPEWDHIADEIPYCRVLNRLLPPDIRIMAWAPVLPPNFSARFSCRERQYRYFFTQPAFAPMPSSLEAPGSSKAGKQGWLDIDKMREAAKMFEGVHDFRNFCKIDPGKQITNFSRRIFESDIVEVKDAESDLPYLGLPEFQPTAGADGSHPKVYYFHVRGSAFLWHQIRHMVAVLFLVGQGLEPPSITQQLLDVEKNPRKPNYVMADEVPLVLWDCIFPKLSDDEAGAAPGTGNGDDSHDPEASGDVDMVDCIDWVWQGEDDPMSLYGAQGLVSELWGTWRERKMDEILANRLLNFVATKPNLERRLFTKGAPIAPPKGIKKVYEGGNKAQFRGSYTPLFKRQLLASAKEVNDKYAQQFGFKDAEEMAKTKDWRSAVRAQKDKNKKAGGRGKAKGAEQPPAEASS